MSDPSTDLKELQELLKAGYSITIPTECGTFYLWPSDVSYDTSQSELTVNSGQQHIVQAVSATNMEELVESLGLDLRTSDSTWDPRVTPITFDRASKPRKQHSSRPLTLRRLCTASAAFSIISVIMRVRQGFKTYDAHANHLKQSTICSEAGTNQSGVFYVSIKKGEASVAHGGCTKLWKVTQDKSGRRPAY